MKAKRILKLKRARAAATFIDDHVSALVVERDDLRARLATAEADALVRAANIAKERGADWTVIFAILSLKPKGQE